MISENDKVPVAILGATGTVGQRFIQLLEDHPWFEVQALAASERSQGKLYYQACNWRLEGKIPSAIREMEVQPLHANMPVKLVFSALPADVALEVEAQFAKKGYVVCSNSSAYRYAEDVPIVIPEINPEQLELIPVQQKNHKWRGLIITSPNCTSTGIAMPLKPLDDAFGVKQVFATTMQAISGAGYPGIPALDISGNVYPYIKGEESKVEKEPRLLLGHIAGGKKAMHPMAISVQVNRVNVVDGHTASLAIKFKREVAVEDVYQALEEYQPPAQSLELNSSPKRVFQLFREPGRPQPRLDIWAEDGMAVSVGQVRPCPILDIKMTTVVHNTLRGAASGSVLNAELLVSQGLV